MARRRSGIILMLLGVVLAGVAAASVYVTMQKGTLVGGAGVARTDVLVALGDIPARTPLTPTMFKVASWPSDLVPPGAITTPEETTGSLAFDAIRAGQPVVESQLIKPDQSANVVAATIESGKVQVVLNLEGAANIAASQMLRVGDHVDLIVIAPSPNKDGNQVVATYRNIEIAGPGAIGTPLEGTVLAFEVEPQDAVELKYLETLTIDVALRSALDDDQESPRTQPVDFKYLVQKYGLQPLPEN